MNFIKKNIFSILLLVSLVLPIVSLAQFGNSGTTVNIPVTNTLAPNGPTTPTTTVTSNTTSTSSTCTGSLPANAKIADLMNYVTCIIGNSFIPLIFTLAIVMFIWGVVQYVINPEQEEKRDKGRQFMLWGIIALAVMVSVWGLVNILGNTFGILNVIPKVNTQ
jgi:hypothetical protein